MNHTTINATGIGSVEMAESSTNQSLVIKKLLAAIFAIPASNIEASILKIRVESIHESRLANAKKYGKRVITQEEVNRQAIALKNRLNIK